MASRAERKARRAAKPVPTESQQMFALMGGFFLGIAIFAAGAFFLISNAPA